MSAFKIATWNVNSLRVRLPHVLAWLARVSPDVLALQETKMPDADFPFDALRDAGYHVVASGQRTYNGVAVLSREVMSDVTTDLPEIDDPQRRVLGVTIGDVRILNVYVPNGERVDSEKYQYKLNWLSKLDAYLAQQLKVHAKMIILGDFNIAPADIDVHAPKVWEASVLCSPKEREAFQAILSLGFQDCFRAVKPDEQAYSWWDYRMNAFRRKMGLRIDHILSVGAHCLDCFIDQAPRALERPSDHAPVVAIFE